MGRAKKDTMYGPHHTKTIGMKRHGNKAGKGVGIKGMFNMMKAG